MDSSSGIDAMAIFVLLFCMAFCLLIIVGMWKIFVKAGQPGWACIIPIYGILVQLRIVGKPWWWLFLLCIPFVNVIFGIWATNLLSKSFGKDEGFTVGMLLLPFVFIPILGFGSATYIGPGGKGDQFGNFPEAAV